MMGYNTSFMEGMGHFWGFGVVLGPVLMISFWALVLFVIYSDSTKIPKNQLTADYQSIQI